MKRIKINFLVGVSLLVCSGFSQAHRLILNDNSYITIDGGAHLVLSNPNPNAITLLGSGGNIISESETDVVNWKIGTNTGAFVIPFTTGTGVKIPLELSISSAGVGTGAVLFSTHTDTDGINSWNNADYVPNGVTNLFGINGLANNSVYVIDRFWSIDAQGYGTKPAGELSFGYNDSERSATGNTIGSGSLKAQYYNSTTNSWVYPSGGADGFPTTSVTGVPTTSGFFKNWTLSEENNPLPVELINFTATEKDNEYVELNWQTASEIDNDYFSVQKSKDGISWIEIDQVLGAGTSVQTNVYSINDYTPYMGTSYYRLEQFDFNGSSEYSNIDAVTFRGLELMNLYPNPYGGGVLNLQVNTHQRLPIFIEVFDNKGSIVYLKEKDLSKGESLVSINLEHIAKGNYIIRIKSRQEIFKDQKELIVH